MHIPEDAHAETRLATVLDAFAPEIRTLAGEAIARMRRRLPGANALLYDNYNALAVGFSPSEKSSLAVFSIAVYPRRVALFFLQGAALPDPNGIFEGAGGQVRSITLDSLDRLSHPHVVEAMDAALAQRPFADRPIGR